MPVGGLPESVLSRATEDVALDGHDEELLVLDVVVMVLRGVFVMRVCAGVTSESDWSSDWLSVVDMSGGTLGSMRLSRNYL